MFSGLNTCWDHIQIGRIKVVFCPHFGRVPSAPTSGPRGFAQGVTFLQTHPEEIKGRAWVHALGWRLRSLEYKSWGSRLPEQRGLGKNGVFGFSPGRPSLVWLLPTSEVHCEGRVFWSIDFSCFCSPLKSTDVYALFYIIYYVHMPLLLVHPLWLQDVLKPLIHGA
jgi:hypothetical protein